MSTALLKLIQSIARPVAKGNLSPGHAHAAIVAQLARGYEGQGEIDWQIKTWSWLLDQNVSNYQALRERISGQIRIAVWDMIKLKKRSNEIMAEAHNINADNNYELIEEEVYNLVQAEFFVAIQRARKNAR